MLGIGGDLEFGFRSFLSSLGDKLCILIFVK